jgi:enterochelin esterase-like enzyme
MSAMIQRKRLALLAALPLLPGLLARASGAIHAAALPQAADTPGGRLLLFEAFPSRHVAPRPVWIWLPPDHDAGEPCAVLYMEDGQNLFYPANPWNHGPWDVDRHLLALRREGKIRKTLVVGIASTGANRSREYMPAAALARLPRSLREEAPESSADGSRSPLSDAYLSFLVEELKPFVDRRYRTRPGPEDTVAMGSSKGGLISLYALARYPRVFGAMGALSTHWPMTTNPTLAEPARAEDRSRLAQAFLDWLSGHLPAPGRHRLYFDHGTTSLDAEYGPWQQRMDALAAAHGYRAGADYMSRVVEGASHDEAAWRARLATPLAFLLRP